MVFRETERKRPMKRSSLLSLPSRLGLLLILVFAYVGCEDSPDTGGLDGYFAAHPYISDPRDSTNASDIDIDPSDTSVTHIGQEILYTVSGGRRPFEWGVARASVGTVAAQGDDRYAIYTALTVDDNNVIVSDRDGSAAIADITPSVTVALQIIPDAVTLTATETNGLPLSLDGSIVDFQVAGGTPPYGDWNVSSPDLGTINSSGRYTVNGTWGVGKNVVSITDSAGSVATATVTLEYSE